jgi:hypothetical protein
MFHVPAFAGTFSLDEKKPQGKILAAENQAGRGPAG